jgi:hypothetical protein
VSGDWSFTNAAGVELRIMRLPDRQNLYLILTDEDMGMHCVARTLGDREALALTSFLDSLTGPSEAAGAPGVDRTYLEMPQPRRRAAEGRES